jgi:Flp pilus assembly protein TadD
LLATLGDANQAIELTRRALAPEPLRANVYNWFGNYYLGINRLDEAERAIRRAIELQPTTSRSPSRSRSAPTEAPPMRRFGR